MSVATGPLRPCEGPNDFEGDGRERYWDSTPAQRKGSLGAIITMTAAWNSEQNKLFAKGWLDEHHRATGKRF